MNCSKRADELVHRLKMQQEAITHSQKENERIRAECDKSRRYIEDKDR
jgi:hypothetical protein